MIITKTSEALATALLWILWWLCSSGITRLFMFTPSSCLLSQSNEVCWGWGWLVRCRWPGEAALPGSSLGLVDVEAMWWCGFENFLLTLSWMLECEAALEELLVSGTAAVDLGAVGTAVAGETWKLTTIYWYPCLNSFTVIFHVTDISFAFLRKWIR